MIHAGADVHWTADCKSLKPTNVDATLEILKAASTSIALRSLVYVTGGRSPRPMVNEDVQNTALEVVRLTGYAQTKFLAELLVQRFARAPAARGCTVAVVQPGHIIGGAAQGAANPRDYLWRLTATCADVGAYNAAEADAWVALADAGHVAEAVVSALDGLPTGKARVVPVLDGMPVRAFWAAVGTELSREIALLDEGPWMARVQREIDAIGPAHRLWPLMEALEAGRGHIGMPGHVTSDGDAGTEKATVVVRANVAHLRRAGFFDTSEDALGKRV